jgi:PAS domain S-box-containing protein
VEFLRGLIESFNRSAVNLQDAYLSLQDKFDRLNLRLEMTNRSLSRSLEEQERLSDHLASILESLSSGVVVVDTEGAITHFNRGAEEMTGIPVHEAVGKLYRQIMGDDLPDELTPLGTLATGEGVSQLEKTLTSRTGERIAVGCSISPLMNRHEVMIGAVEIFMNLNRIKALEDELSRMDKLAALGQMAATMAHKIRNPLGGIAGFAGLLEFEMEGNARGKRLVGKVSEGVEKLNRIVTSLVTYAAQPHLRPQRSDLGLRLREVVNQYEPEQIPGISIEMVQPEGPVAVEVDREQFADAVRKVVQNALEAIESEGTVSLYVLPGNYAFQPSGPVVADLLDRMRSGSKLITSRIPCGIAVVADSGCGMDDRGLDRLFVPFYTTKENGIGLGLAAARKIVEAHHGEIWIASRETAGTAVGMILPCVSTIGERRPGG